MPREFTPKVITANALMQGDVVYLADNDQWTRHLEDAAILTDEADAALRLLLAQARSAEVVGVYLADVTAEGGTPAPTHFREDFRRTGPSNYFHGKQAEAR
ncbi:DUF2849 domain-containing protein [Roseovarius dicentrarchi]|uniref:DUF2849 domain-containing protein n=1 Tax=Roseovarius dicentrarchi TaxID=2250573 RepID=UPI000DE96B71|nr:DUF2849 domain-containing protein [Roseovarius dicentrarchi]